MQSPETTPMTPDSLSALRATAIVGLGSAISLGLSVVTAKAYALLVGPAGVGLLSLMQSVLVIGVMVASAGLATSSVRLVANQIDRGNVRAATRAALRIAVIGGGIGALVMVVMQGPLAVLVIGSSDGEATITILAAALALSTIASVQVAVLTGLHEVRKVVTVNVGTALVAAIAGIAIVAALGESGLVLALLVTAGGQLGLSHLALRVALRGRVSATGQTVESGRSIVRAGVPIAAGQVAGSGVMFLVPMLVLHLLSVEQVGYYRPAAAISIGYLTFFLGVLTQDYYPRLSRTTDPVELAGLVERRMRLMMGLAVPLIMALVAAGPLLVEFLYTAEFAPASEVLRWQLVGDLFRIPAWIFVFVLLAQASALTYMAAQLAAGALLLGATAVGLIVVGLPGAGAGYAAAQLATYAVMWLLVRRHVATTPGRLQAVVLLTSAASGVMLVVPIDDALRSVLFGIAAAGFAAVSWPRIYRLHRSGSL